MIIQTIRMKSVTAEGMGTLSVFEAERVPIPTMSRRASSAAATPTKSCAKSCGVPMARF